MAVTTKIKIKIGDIIEIPTQKGLVYAQYTHEHSESPHFGSLIRVFSDFYDERPEDFNEVAKSQTKFGTFFPLEISVKLKLVTIVANKPIISKSQRFPIFRAGLRAPKTGRVEVWWFWDGEKEWKVGEITEDQRKLPIRQIVNYAELVKMIESGWTPETDSSS